MVESKIIFLKQIIFTSKSGSYQEQDNALISNDSAYLSYKSLLGKESLPC